MAKAARLAILAAAAFAASYLLFSHGASLFNNPLPIDLF